MKLTMPSRRRLGAAMALVLVLAVAAGTVGGLLRLRLDTSLDSLLPKNDPSMRKLADKAEAFGGDPVVVLLESERPMRLLLDRQQLPRLLRLEGELSRLRGADAVYGPATVLNQVAITAQNLMAQISGMRDGLRAAAERRAKENGASDAEAKQAGARAVARFEDRYGRLAVRGLPAGLPTTRNPGFVRSVMYDAAGTPRPRWHAVVPSRHAVAILVRPAADLDSAGTQHLVTSVRAAVRDAGLATSNVTVTGVPTVTSSLITQVRQELPLVGGVALGGIALCFLLAPRLGSRRARWWPIVATLAGTALTLAAFGWVDRPLSVGVVAFLPILLGIGSDFPLYLASGGIRRVLVTAAAGAAGFAAMAVSPLPFVRELGYALALGLVCTTGVAVLLRTRLRSLAPPEPDPSKDSEWVSVAARVGKGGRIGLLGLAAVVAVLGWVALPRIDIEADPQRLAEGLPVMADAEHAERVTGASGEVAVLLEGKDVLHPDALAWSRRAEQAVLSRHGDTFAPVVSVPEVLGFLGPDPTSQQIAAATTIVPEYLVSTVVTPDRRMSSLVLGIKLQDLAAQRRSLDELRAALPPPPPGMRTSVVGLPVSAVRGHDLLANGRYAANLVGIVAAGAVLALGLRRRRDAWRAIVAAMLATGWVLAGTWLFGVSLSPLSVALGSLTTVVACEYTVMLGARDGWRRRGAAARSVAFACLSATIGYLALTVSSLPFFRGFGLLLAVSVVASYVAARLVWAVPGRRERTGGAPSAANPSQPTVEEATL